MSLPLLNANVAGLSNGSLRFVASSSRWSRRSPRAVLYNHYAMTIPLHSRPSSTSSSPSKPGKQNKIIAEPRPSSSVLLISARNEILLLHRVHNSKSFASAHVFPGGNVSAVQDQEPNGGGSDLPSSDDIRIHLDAAPYRQAAIRELFEESGILLARDRATGRPVHVPAEEREQGRRAVHNNEVRFVEWVRRFGEEVVPDTDGLVPFTHWITPPNLPKRFTTQMYLYFLPLDNNGSNGDSASSLQQGAPPSGGQREEIQIPTDDGGVEIAEAQFLPANAWLRKAQRGEIMLYPPQFFLLHLVSQFLDTENAAIADTPTAAESQRRRDELLAFVRSGNPPWTDRYICPRSIKMLDDKRVVLALDHPGPELAGSDKQGDRERVILVRFTKDGPREVDVRWRREFQSSPAASL